MSEVVVVGSFKAEPGKEAEALPDAHARGAARRGDPRARARVVRRERAITVYDAVPAGDAKQGALAAWT